MKIFIQGNGCDRRKLDVSKFHAYFRLNEYQIVNRPDDADYILVATCAFKKEEEDHSVSLIRTLSKHRGKIVVYGCLPDIAPNLYHELFAYEFIAPRNIDDIDAHFENITHKFGDVKDENLILRNLSRASWTDALGSMKRDFEFSKPFLARSFRYMADKLSMSNRQYYLFTSRGCLGTCSYCAVKYAIGRVRSKPMETILREFKEGLRGGYADFLVLGDDVGAYGHDIGAGFPDIFAALFPVMDEFGKNGSSKVGIHINELNPRWLIQYKDEMVALSGSGRIRSILCPMQSGNDKVLRQMKRGHAAAAAFSVLNEIHAADPAISLTTQIIVGFPGESDDEFMETLERIVESPLKMITIFPYDEKKNTPAALLTPKVPAEVIEKRVQAAMKYLRAHGRTAALSCSDL